MEEDASERKVKILNWFKDKYNFSFLIVFILGIALRLYYFTITKTQALWWDEADYMAYAKNLAGYSTHWIVTGEHSSIFINVVAVFFKMGFSEQVIKFCLEVLPSILLIPLTYYSIILIYNNKKLALISSFLMAVFWNLLFNSMRFQVDVPAFFLAVLAMYVFFQGYERKQKIFGLLDCKWAILITLILVVLTYAVRRGYFVIGFFFLFYLLFTKPVKEIIKDKWIWIGFISAVILFFAIEKIFFVQSIASASATYYHPELPITGIDLLIFGSFFKDFQGFNPLFYMFWIGFAIMTLNVIFSFGYFKTTSNSEIKGDIFFFISWILTMSYFIFYQRTSNLGDPRWYNPLLLASFICIARFSLSIPKIIKEYSEKNFAQYSKYLYWILVILMACLLIYGGYFQIKHADEIIKVKVPSFAGIKDASLFIKENSNPEDIIVSVSRPQPAYYAERETHSLQELIGPDNPQVTLDQFLYFLENNASSNVKFLIVTFSQQGQPDWMQKTSYVQNPATGQVAASKLEIPFMDTFVDFSTSKQNIIQSKTYENITFNILTIKDDALVYSISKK